MKQIRERASEAEALVQESEGKGIRPAAFKASMFVTGVSRGLCSRSAAGRVQSDALARVGDEADLTFAKHL